MDLIWKVRFKRYETARVSAWPQVTIWFQTRVSLVVLGHLGFGIASRYIVQRFQVLDAFVTLHVVTCVGDPPHGFHPVRGIVIVQTLRFQKCAHGLGGLAGIVPGHFVKQMMDHVGATNRVMKEIKNAVGSINRGECSLDPGPFAFTVVRDGRIRVL